MKRPGCVSAYAILVTIPILLVMAVILGFTLQGAALAARGTLTPTTLAVLGGGFVLVGVFYFLLVRGLWRLKNWARILVIFLQSIGGYLFLSATIAAEEVIWGIFILVLSAYIIYWFAVHREVFGG